MCERVTTRLRGRRRRGGRRENKVPFSPPETLLGLSAAFPTPCTACHAGYVKTGVDFTQDRMTKGESFFKSIVQRLDEFTSSKGKQLRTMAEKKNNSDSYSGKERGVRHTW